MGVRLVNVAFVPVKIPEELENKVRRMPAECERISLPDCPPPRRVLDLGCGAGAFLVYATIAWDYPWVIGVDAHPWLCELASENAPPGARVHLAAISSTETGEATVAVRGSASAKVRIISPADLPAAELVRLNIQGREGEFLDAYRYLDQVRWLYVDWHAELHETIALQYKLLTSGFRRLRGVAYLPNRSSEIWARSRSVFDGRANRWVLPPEPAT